MSTLRVRIHKYISDQKNPPQIYASIRSIVKSGSQKKKQAVRQELVPVTDQPDSAKAIEVTPGHYYVETVLPSGEALSEDVVVKTGQTKDVVLKPDEQSPHEWLSWQQIAGNVQSQVVETPKPVPGPAHGTFTGGKTFGGTKTANRWTRYIHTDSAALPPPALESVPAPEVDVRGPLEWLTQPHRSLSTGAGVWQWLATLTSNAPGELIRRLNGGRPTLKVSPAVFDNEHGIFRVSLKQTAGVGVVVLKGHPGKGQRTYLVVRRRTGVELLLLPLPWFVLRDEREADIEVAVQQPADPMGFCSSAIARDEDFGMFLGFLSSGSLPTVRRLAETAKEMLYEKHMNPFAAVAGAYALVGTAMEAKDKEWHQWVFNLLTRFPFIPDGAIQWGQLKMRMRRSADEIAEAKRAFKEGYNRGLPVYSLGVRWLLEGLEWASDGDPQAKQMADDVRRIAYRTNYQQPFATVRVGGNEDVRN